MVVRIAVLLAGPLLYLLLYAQSHMLPDRVGWLVVPDLRGPRAAAWSANWHI